MNRHILRYLNTIFPRTHTRILIVSVPKAGTHLIGRLLSLYPQLSMSKIDLIELSQKEEINQLEHVKFGQIASTHSSPTPEYTQFLTEKNFKIILMLRDPRDVCVSFLHWIMYKDLNNPHRPYFISLDDDDARLRAAIIGMDEAAKKLGAWWDNIDQEFRERLPWKVNPDCITVTFEELVGAKGGGNDLLQYETIKRISEHLKIKLKEREIQYVLDNAFAKTTTFRKGQIGDWRNHFKPDHKQLFKTIAGQLLIELGYETNLDW